MPIEDEGPTETQAASKGERVRDGDLEFVVDRVRTTDVIADPGFPDVNTTADGGYVIVELIVTNVSAEPKTFIASFSTLSDGTAEFEADDQAWPYLVPPTRTWLQVRRSRASWCSTCSRTPTSSRSSFAPDPCRTAWQSVCEQRFG